MRAGLDGIGRSSHVWTVMLDNTMFGDFNPFATPIFGDWLEMPKFGKDPDKHLGDVYLNGVSFFESTTWKAYTIRSRVIRMRISR